MTFCYYLFLFYFVIKSYLKAIFFASFLHCFLNLIHSWNKYLFTYYLFLLYSMWHPEVAQLNQLRQSISENSQPLRQV